MVRRDRAAAGREIAPDDKTFRLFVESVQDYAIFLLEADGTVATWNVGAERIKQYRESEIVGRHFSIFYPPDAVARGWPQHELEVAAREGRFEDEGWRVRKDGTRFWANVVITAVLDEKGRVRGFSKVTRDMTERRRAAEQAERLAREEAARTEAQKANRRLQALVDASRAMAEARLDFAMLAQTIADRLVQNLGDACVVCVQRGEALVPVASAQVDAQAAELLQEFVGSDAVTPAFVREALRTRTTVVSDRGQAPRGRSRGAVLAAPMIVPGGETLGLIALVRTADRPTYSDEERLIVEALGSRSALALANATLYQEAREAHERLLLTFAAMAEGVIVQDPANRIVMANDAAARLCGFDSAAELLAAPIGEVVSRFDVFDEEGAPFPPDRLPARRALGGEEHAEALIRWRRKGASIDRWSISKATPVRRTDGRVVYAISVIEEITERRRSFEGLRFLSDAGEILASSLDYERTLTAVANAAVPRIGDWCLVHIAGEGRVRRVAMAHRDPKKVAWAEELERRYPVEPDAPYGVAAVLRTGRPELVSDVSDSLLAARARNAEHLQILREIAPTSFLCITLVGNGPVIGALTLLATRESGRRFDEQDLTMAILLGRRAGLAVENARLYAETQRALDQVTDVSRVKDEFLATLSHELRTPLNAIVGWTRLLQSGSLTPDQVEKGLATIARNAALQSQLIGDIVDVSRIMTGKIRLNVQSIHPLKVVEDAIESLRPAADAKGVRIESILDPHAGPISGDPERLQQVVWNLLSNAVKFVPKGGRVQVRLEAVNSHVEIVVEDDGPGIPPEFLPHVFERFRQADSSSTRGHKGLGLGLSIVQHLVELHGGSVRAANCEGGGAVFTVVVPRRAILSSAVTQPLGAGGVADGGPSLRGVKVMLVDDEQDAREMLALGLEKSGAEVVTLRSAGEVADRIAGFRPHVLLADIEMPGVDGYMLLRELRSRPPDEGGLTPAIAITAYAAMEDRIRALSAGFDLHLPKPVQLAELRTAVARLAGQRR